MQKETKWRAIWIDYTGRVREYHFTSEDSFVVARLDFQLRLLDRRERIPDEFELDEIGSGQETLKLPALPPRDC